MQKKHKKQKSVQPKKKCIDVLISLAVWGLGCFTRDLQQRAQTLCPWPVGSELGAAGVVARGALWRVGPSFLNMARQILLVFFN